MSGTEATNATTLPVSQPYRSTLVKRTVQLPSRVFGRFKESTRKPLNNKGYLFSLMERSNPQIGGGMNSGDTMLTGGSDEYITLLVGGVVTNGARAWNGGAVREMADGNYYGLSRSDQEIMDADRFATEQDKNLCFAGRTYARGVINGTPTYDSGSGLSTVTFLSAQNGSYYLREMEGRKFLFHHPTTFAAHGGTTPFELKDCPTALTARFIGDVTGGTAIATNDIAVPIGTADNKSSVNKGINNLDYMTSNTGEYYSVKVDNHPKTKSIQYDLAGNEVTRAILEYMDGLYTLNYPADPVGTANHTDIFSPTQEMKMYFQAEGALRINSTSGMVNYDPKITFKGWMGRPKLITNHVLPSTWYINDLRDAFRGVQREFSSWDYDKQEYRAIPASGSIRDAIQKHWLAVDQVWHEDKRKNMAMYNCATAGAATPANI